MSLTLDDRRSRETSTTFRFLSAAARSVLRLAAAVNRMIVAELDRRQTMALMFWDARALADIGVSRSDVAGALLSGPDTRPSDDLARRRCEARQGAEAQRAEARTARL